MTFIFWTVVCAAITLVALFYIVRLVMNRKNNLDFPIHLFVVISIFIIGGIFTGIQIFELSLKWTNNAPTIEGACTIDLAHKSTSIYFEEENLNLSASMWLDIQYGKYDHCKAIYYPISKEIIEIQYENKIGE